MPPALQRVRRAMASCRTVCTAAARGLSAELRRTCSHSAAYVGAAASAVRCSSWTRPPRAVRTGSPARGRWSRTRRVVIKAEVVRLAGREPKDNPRFVVTNMRQTPRFLYEKVYCARGDVENRIKELKALQIDRTSCHAFAANQLRVFLTAAACVLMQELRSCAADTARPA